jgi:aspartate aminotransferase-like enzyme/N-acyl-L-homoserine lactone synthetase
MLRVGCYTFKIAETSHEIEQVHRLNYRTFVDEIPQHEDTGTGMLVDKFHHKNTYLIVLRASKLVGMMSVHDQPPFSVASRMPDPELLERRGTKPLEVRLLAIEPAERNGTMFFGLVWFFYNYAMAQGYTHLFISAVADKIELYKRINFKPLGPAVQSGKALFVPMMLDVKEMPERLLRLKVMWETRIDRVSPKAKEPVCLLPGPVTVSAAVRKAFQEPSIYHRGPEFIAKYGQVRRALAALTKSRDVAILNGSGTLANEAVAAALAAGPRQGRGVLLVNGEFGQRLARQARRFGLEPRQLTWKWGEAWDLDEVEAALDDEPAGSWVWGVHQESSTGVLNDLAGLVELARARDVRVCLDSVSSLGAVPLDLSGVYLATGATGKSLGAYAGAALVFAGAGAPGDIDPSRVPSYFDLPAAMASDGPIYTFPSPTLRALEVALQEYATPEQAQARYHHYAALGACVRQQLRGVGLEPLAPDEWACPVVTTFAPPNEESAGAFVERCRAWGFAIGGQSGYLAERRLVQIATMGAVTQEELLPLFEYLQMPTRSDLAALQPV